MPQSNDLHNTVASISTGDDYAHLEASRAFNVCKERNSFIIEDDYDSELRYYQRPIPALKSIDYLDRVIYLGTFSKILSPSFRMGYMVLPEQFTEKFLEKGKLYNSTVNLLNQIALANILSSGDYDRLVRKMNHVFKKRYEAFKQEFQKFKTPIELSSNVSGQYFCYL